MQYPTLQLARCAGILHLTEWVRRLPSPATDEQVEIMNVIVERRAQLQKLDPAAATRASKSIGLD